MEQAKKALNKKGIMVILFALIVLLAIIIAFAVTRKRNGDINEYMELGRKYLEEMNYEQAVIAFTNAIKIDDREVEAYIGRAQAYAALGEDQKAADDIATALELAPEREAELKELRTQILPDYEDQNGPNEGNDRTPNENAASANLPLNADQLTWLVEPSYAFDDVEPVWAMDFSDVSGEGPEAFSDGKTALVSNGWGKHFTEMSFPQYSCLPEYYQVRNGDQIRLFYMPSRETSGDLVYSLSNEGGEAPYIYDCYTLLWDYNNLWRPDGSYLADSMAFPWNVVGTADRGGGTGQLVYDIDSRQVYFAWDFDGPGDVTPLTELNLHKPYPIQRATIQHDNTFDTNYADIEESGYAFADPSGALITDFIYDDTGTFSDGVAAVCKNGKWGYIDETGNELTEMMYDSVWAERVSWSGGALAYPCTCDIMVVSQNGQMGVLYRDGSLLIDYGQFEDLAPAWNNQLWAKQNGQWGLIDLADAKAKAGLSEWNVSKAYDPEAEALAVLQVQPDLLDADEQKTYTVTANPSLIMRAGPGTEYDRLSTIPNGTQIKAISQQRDDWIAVEYGGLYGWVSLQYLQ